MTCVRRVSSAVNSVGPYWPEGSNVGQSPNISG